MATNASLTAMFDHESTADSFNVLTQNRVLSSAGMAIKTGSDPDAKFANTITFAIGGKFAAPKTTGNLDLSALLSGKTLTIADDYQNTVAFFINAGGTITADIATSVAITEDMPAIPDFDDDVVCFGAITIKNESGSTFTVGTTALDKSGVTSTYYNLTGGWSGMTLA